MGDRATVVALAATTTVAYGVLLVPMEDDLGWSRPFLSGALSLGLVFGALSTIPVGRWLDRNPPRPLFLLGGVVSSLLVVGWSAAHSRWVFILTWILTAAYLLRRSRPSPSPCTRWRTWASAASAFGVAATVLDEDPAALAPGG